jgi:shikimate kinase
MERLPECEYEVWIFFTIFQNKTTARFYENMISLRSVFLSPDDRNDLRRKPMKNVVIIGMPGAGKSTLGVILAKTLGRNFIDTDIVAQENTRRLLQEIIDEEGTDAFLRTEERTILSLQCRNTVIATGGSVVFSEKAMKHLKKEGIVIYLKISFEGMVRRLNNITTRGIVLFAGQSLREMYDQRVPLYEKYSDITIDCSDGDFENCIGNVIDELQKFPE